MAEHDITCRYRDPSVQRLTVKQTRDLLERISTLEWAILWWYRDHPGDGEEVLIREARKIKVCCEIDYREDT